MVHLFILTRKNKINNNKKKQAQLLSQAVAAQSALASSSSASDSDAHPVTSSLGLSPLGFGLLVTRIPDPTADGSSSGGGMAQSLIDSFRRYAAISSSSAAGEEAAAPKPFVLIGEGEVSEPEKEEGDRCIQPPAGPKLKHTIPPPPPTKPQLLPAQCSVRIAPSDKGQADLHVQLVAVSGAGGGEGEVVAVHPLGSFALAPPEGEEEVSRGGGGGTWGLFFLVCLLACLLACFCFI